ncbi:MAG: AsnC family transcriptional regulator [Betaproteobacteria bacterium]|jgi:DNA-binding Lrp family transcriptional regulator|nr:MAG: AsnC family transcriptional regulator [Betaproteobacteria bacterium]
MDELDRAVINALQGDFPVSERPFLDAAARLGISEHELIERIRRLLDQRVLTRFGPLWQVERLGGAYALAAMKVPQAEFERVAEKVNALPEVAHNYEREHAFNMWFVLATETPEALEDAAARIERETGHRVYLMPKAEEYFVGLTLAA